MTHRACNNCGYSMRHIKTGNKWVCDSCCEVVNDEPETPILLPSEHAGYDSNLCQSLDHKSSALQMQAIDKAMQRYFGKDLHVPATVVLNELSEDVLYNTGTLVLNWQEKRDKEFPGLFNRGYL